MKKSKFNRGAAIRVMMGAVFGAPGRVQAIFNGWESVKVAYPDDESHKGLDDDFLHSTHTEADLLGYWYLVNGSDGGIYSEKNLTSCDNAIVLKKEQEHVDWLVSGCNGILSRRTAEELQKVYPEVKIFYGKMEIVFHQESSYRLHWIEDPDGPMAIWPEKIKDPENHWSYSLSLPVFCKSRKREFDGESIKEVDVESSFGWFTKNKHKLRRGFASFKNHILSWSEDPKGDCEMSFPSGEYSSATEESREHSQWDMRYSSNWHRIFQFRLPKVDGADICYWSKDQRGIRFPDGSVTDSKKGEGDTGNPETPQAADSAK